jgi:GntR family transcriptional repressor for pyruvate dehydrogenase complex
VLDRVWVSINSDSSYFDALQVTREFLEPEIAALAARNATSDNLAELQFLLNAQIKCDGDALEHARKDIEWHAALSRATQNPILNQIHNSIANLGIKTRTATARLPGSLDHAVHWHKEIMQAVKSKDPDLARAAMRMHLNQVRADLDEALQIT